MSKSVSPVIVAAHEVSIRFGEQVVLKKATLNVHQRDRIGLIGNNGSGKSTLLKIIAGIMPPDSGTVSRGKEVVTGYLPQDFQLDTSKSVYDNIVEGAHDVIDALREYEALPYTSPKRHLLEQHIHHRDGWNLENRIETAMHSLNVPGNSATLRRFPAERSGAWRFAERSSPVPISLSSTSRRIISTRNLLSGWRNFWPAIPERAFL